MTDMPSDHDRLARFVSWHERTEANAINHLFYSDDAAIYAGRNPKRPTRWQRAKWIVHDDITTAREYVSDVLWNLAEWIRP